MRNKVFLLLLMENHNIFLSITATEMYCSQSKSIREDLPVLQRLCPATIFQKPLTKRLHSLILCCIFMYVISGVVIKHELLLFLPPFGFLKLRCGYSERFL